MITLYTLENCPQCEKMKEWLKTAGYEFQVRDMSSAESLTDMRVAGCYENVAPVLEIEGRFYSWQQCQDKTFLSSIFGESLPVNAVEIDLGREVTHQTLQEQAEQKAEAAAARTEDTAATPVYISAEVVTGRYAPDLYADMERNIGPEHIPKCLTRDTALESGQVVLDVIIGGLRFDMALRFKK